MKANVARMNVQFEMFRAMCYFYAGFTTSSSGIARVEMDKKIDSSFQRILFVNNFWNVKSSTFN